MVLGWAATAEAGLGAGCCCERHKPVKVTRDRPSQEWTRTCAGQAKLMPALDCDSLLGFLLKLQEVQSSAWGGGPTPMHPSTQPELKLPSEGCRGNFRGFRQFSRDPVFFVEQVFKRDMKIHVIILRFCWKSVVRADMSANRQREDTRGLAKRSTFVGLFAARSTPQTHRQPNRSPAESRVISSDPGH